MADLTEKIQEWIECCNNAMAEDELLGSVIVEGSELIQFREALTLSLRSVRQEPVDYVMVPREPTETMLDAAIAGKTLTADFGAQERARKYYADVYRKMLSAAPPSASVEQAIALVAEQAENEGLWFDAATVTEAHLQAALRALHAAVEADAAGKGWQSVEQARREALEEAAKVCKTMREEWAKKHPGPKSGTTGAFDAAYCSALDNAETNIRALAQGGKP